MSTMATEIDPAGFEPRAILQAVDLRGADVLEVGAGDGRLTFRYAEVVRSVVGIDPKESEIRRAAQTACAEGLGQTRFLCASGLHLPFSAEAFRNCFARILFVMNAARGHGRCPARSAAGSEAIGHLIDARPVTVPLTVEVVVGDRPIWGRQVASYSTPEDIAAADAAVGRALMHGWFATGNAVPYELEIYCDTAADLRLYVQGRKLPESQMPYQELEERRNEIRAAGPAARLRCRRPWMLTTYRKS